MRECENYYSCTSATRMATKKCDITRTYRQIRHEITPILYARLTFFADSITDIETLTTLPGCDGIAHIIIYYWAAEMICTESSLGTLPRDGAFDMFKSLRRVSVTHPSWAFAQQRDLSAILHIRSLLGKSILEVFYGCEQSVFWSWKRAEKRRQCRQRMG